MTRLLYGKRTPPSRIIDGFHTAGLCSRPVQSLSPMSSQVIHHLCALDKSSPHFLRSLYTFVRLDERGEYSRNLQHSESARLVDFLDGALDVIPVTDVLFRRCLRTLRFICANHNVFPSSHIMREGLKKTGDNPVAFGGFADVWEGTYGGEKVCVKALRIYNVGTSTNSPNNAVASFHGEAVIWKRLRHPNVVGVSRRHDNTFANRARMDAKWHIDGLREFPPTS